MTNDLAADIFDGSMTVPQPPPDDLDEILGEDAEEVVKVEDSAPQDSAPQDSETNDIELEEAAQVSPIIDTNGGDGIDDIDAFMSTPPANLETGSPSNRSFPVPFLTNTQIRRAFDGETVTAADLLVDIKGKAYLPSQARVWLFRQKFGHEWQIQTVTEEYVREQLITENGKTVKIHGYARVRCNIIDPKGVVIATSIKTWQSTKSAGEFVLEAAESGAIGRALALMGIGTLAAQYDFSEGRVVDAPQ